jgi:hypothetical protein
MAAVHRFGLLFVNYFSCTLSQLVEYSASFCIVMMEMDGHTSGGHLGDKRTIHKVQPVTIGCTYGVMSRGVVNRVTSVPPVDVPEPEVVA